MIGKEKVQLTAAIFHSPLIYFLSLTSHKYLSLKIIMFFLEKKNHVSDIIRQ